MKMNFPHCVDAQQEAPKHIMSQEKEDDYFNYKSFHSIMLSASS